MMRRRTSRLGLWLLLWLASVAPAAAQRPLTPDAEAGFRQLMRMAQAGELGSEIANANVGVERERVSVELVRADGSTQRFTLTARGAAPAASRFFAIAAGAGASEDDVARLGRALDACFAHDPFDLGDDFFAADQDGGVPTLGEAWASDGWHGAGRALLRRMASPAGLRYTVAVIALLAIGVLASVAILCTTPPPGDRG
jgi:hypothetical protein